MLDNIQGPQNRLDIITALIKLSEKYPHERFCQIISNSIQMAGFQDTDIFYIEDSYLLKCLRERLEK